LIFSIFAVSLCVSCSKSKPASPPTTLQASIQNLPIDANRKGECLQAARKLLGPDGQVLKCGHLVDPTVLEAVVVSRVPGLKDNKDGIPVSKLLILREIGTQWKSELEVDREITNSAGYVGINFIDDSHPYPYYRAKFTDEGAQWGARSASQFTLVLLSMTRGGKIDPEELGIGIGWNLAAGRIQEIEPDGEHFAPEVTTPKHIRN
jgi:hypothetical protein